MFIRCGLIGLVLGLVVIAAVGQANRQLTKEAGQARDARTALVIGNSGYAEAPLRNPGNDAADMAAALRAAGFDVLAYTDLDQTGMKKAIRDFGAKLRDRGGVGLFYFSGHGVQVKGLNYLIPVRAAVNTEEEVEYESVEAGFVLAQMESAKNGLNIVILDACRNNPFARSYRSAEKGLAQINAPAGTLIAYSTAPGSVASDGQGRNGVYTAELLKQMRQPGVGIEEVFKQVRISVRGITGERQTPWESSSLTGDFYFTGGKAGSTPLRVRTEPEPVNAPVQRPTPSTPTDTSSAKVDAAVVDEAMFSFRLERCQRSGTMAVCEFTITNKDTMDKKLGFEWLENGRAFDETGVQAKMESWQIANASGWGSSATLLPGVPVKGVVRFTGLSRNAASLKRIDLGLTARFSEGGYYKTKDLVVHFKDVTLR
jgi:hypothetical protein